jgi:hypothetical protein
MQKAPTMDTGELLITVREEAPAIALDLERGSA